MIFLSSAKEKKKKILGFEMNGFFFSSFKCNVNSTFPAIFICFNWIYCKFSNYTWYNSLNATEIFRFHDYFYLFSLNFTKNLWTIIFLILFVKFSTMKDSTQDGKSIDYFDWNRGEKASFLSLILKKNIKNCEN